MENTKAFEERDVVAICEHITTYCQKYICSSPMNIHYARSFYMFLPELLVQLFGSPNVRGFLQTRLANHQTNALKKLLCVDSPFLQSLIKLTQNKEYCYDLTNESLPADVRKVLSTGATHLLPKVYSNCVSASSVATAHTIDIRTAATTQSTLLPANLNYEVKIQFNMLQFYLYYYSNIPSWKPSGETLPRRGPLNRLAASAIESATVRLTDSIYTEILDQYLVNLIQVHGNTLSSPVGRFYLDALVELWIRTPWIPSNGRLDSTLMFYTTYFITYVVKNDIKNCMDRSVTYEAVRDELYMLISRLALNWERTDEYIQVVELWALWASAWRRGAPTRSLENNTYQPIQKGWGPFILDNIPFYFSMMDIFLERTSQYNYVDSTTSLAGQLRSIYRIMNLFKAEGLLGYLDEVEQALNLPTLETAHTQNLASLSNISESQIREKIQRANLRLAELDGQQPWKSKGLYTQEPKRSPVLIQSLHKLYEAINTRDSNKQATNKPSRHLEQLQEAYKVFVNTFRLHNYQPMRSINNVLSTARLTEIEYAGLQNEGFLTPEELEKIKQGKIVCSPNSIPALGRRAQTLVRSYENPTLVRWSIQIDRYINNIVSAS
ncbi:hypothetical protein BY458DRAFT_557713 [Sporodiniella umbellata]|nr:hypothetical protein BY458DRAFT_557713 [Sporodiniella umbellata]